MPHPGAQVPHASRLGPRRRGARRAAAIHPFMEPPQRPTVQQDDAAHSIIDELDKDRVRAAFEAVRRLETERARAREGGRGAAGAAAVANAGSMDDIEYVAETYEMATISMWRYAARGGGAAADAKGEEAGAARRAGELEGLCRTAFALMEACPVPDEPIEKICHVLLMFSYAYVGGRGEDMGHYLDERGEEASLPEVKVEGSGMGWEYDMLAGIYSALLCVIRKRDAAELRRARGTIARLREMQGLHERGHLESFAPDHRLNPARRLASLYHLAKCVELLAEFMETGRPDGIERELDFHFDEAFSHGCDSGSAELDVLLRTVRPAFVRMARGAAGAPAGPAGNGNGNGAACLAGRRGPDGGDAGSTRQQAEKRQG